MRIPSAGERFGSVLATRQVGSFLLRRSRFAPRQRRPSHHHAAPCFSFVVRSAIPRLAAGETVAPPTLPALRAAPLPDHELRRHEGTFHLSNGTRLVMRARGGVLWANDWVLLPMADGGFFSPRDYGKVRGVAGADGRIGRLDWEQRGRVYPAPRVAG